MKTTKGGFTRGEVTHLNHLSNREHRIGIYTDTGYYTLAETNREFKEWKENASLIAAAFTAATEVEDMGYDGMEAVRLLAELLTHVALIDRFAFHGLPVHKSQYEVLHALLTRIKGEGKEAEHE